MASEFLSYGHAYFLKRYIRQALDEHFTARLGLPVRVTPSGELDRDEADRIRNQLIIDMLARGYRLRARCTIVLRFNLADKVLRAVGRDQANGCDCDLVDVFEENPPL